MSGAIYIRDENPKGFVCVRLSQILESIQDRGRRLVWSILHIEAVGYPARLGKSVPDLEEEIRRAPKGLVLPWQQLTVVADALTDVIDCVIVACQDMSLVPSYQRGFDPRP